MLWPPRTIVPELLITRVPLPLVMDSDEAPDVSPMTNVPALLITSLRPALSKKLNVVAPLVARRPLLEFVSASEPFVNVLAPDVCHEVALVLLNTEAPARERLTAPVMRPALLMVTIPVPSVVAPMARSDAEPPTDAITPVALLLMVILPVVALPITLETLTTAVPADVPN